MADQFEEEMTHLRRLIDGSVRLSIPMPAAVPPSGRAPSRQSVPAPNPSSLPTAAALQVPEPRASKRTSILLAAAVALVAVVVVIVGLQQRAAPLPQPQTRPSATASPRVLRARDAVDAQAAVTAAAPTAHALPRDAAGQVSSASKARRAAPEPPQAAPAVRVAAPPPPSVAPAARLEPGADLRQQPATVGGDRLKHGLDERDPY